MIEYYNRNRLPVSWLLMMSLVVIHVMDEVATGFHPLYLNVAADINEQVDFALVPVFSFQSWLIGLTVVVATGSSLTLLIGRRRRVLTIITVPWLSES